MLSRISENDLAHNPRTVNLALRACADAAARAQAGEGGEDVVAGAVADLGLRSLREVLDVSAVAASRALGPRANGKVRGPPVDRATVELTGQLLSFAPLEPAEMEQLVASIETATLKAQRVRPSGKSAGRGRGRGRGRGGRGGRGKGGKGGKGVREVDAAMPWTSSATA